MTAFNFILRPEFVTIVADTLNCFGPENRPYIYNSKLHVVPHLHAAVGGKGQGLFLLECHKALMVRIIARDIVDADSDVPDVYQQLWLEHQELCKREGHEMTNAKATMYHFGWVPSKNRVVGFEYKSGDDFASERLPDGCWLHPYRDPKIIVREPEDLVRVTLKQKEIDDRKPPEKRAGIGGDLHLLHLTKEGMAVQIRHRASDYETLFEQMVALAKESSDER